MFPSLTSLYFEKTEQKREHELVYCKCECEYERV